MNHPLMLPSQQAAHSNQKSQALKKDNIDINKAHNK